MGILNINYNVTAKNNEIIIDPPKVYKTLFGISAPLQMVAAGRTKWFDISQPDDNVGVELACDGTIVAYVKPGGGVLRGEITFNPSSPSVSTLASMCTKQNNIGVPFACKVDIFNPIVGTYVSYSNFFFTKTFPGWSFNQMTEDVVFPFATVPTDYLDLASLTSIVASI